MQNEILAGSTSGEIKVNSFTTEKADISSVGGDINIEITADEKTRFTASVSKASGEFSSSFPIIDKGDKKVYGNGKSIFEFGTVSGDIDINNN